jgi:hypothetical protein
MVTLAEINEAYRNGSKDERREFCNLIAPEFIESPIFDSPEFKAAIENVLIISELKPIKRISTIETVLGLNDLQEEEQVTIPEQLNILAERIDNISQNTVKATDNSQEEIIPKTTLEQKAVKLMESLKIKPRNRAGEVFLDNKELTNFLVKELPDELRTNDSNLRRVKKRVIEKTRSLFPGSISINKSKYGRHETRIIYKESYQSNRNGTLV